eukprot:c18693_g1_i1.p1 GENE.c18693_g1_i1~~c18693_g1_i1.p1  ORF type:complete len:171 (-),score=40.47 c18693_g1_i1:170-682(-)
MIVICSETDDYRVLARAQPNSTDHVVEIGCSAGVATALIYERCSNIIAIDISHSLLHHAATVLPNVNFVNLDVLAEDKRLEELCQGCTKMFVDIGGNRCLESLAILLPKIRSVATPQLIFVKSRQLFKYTRKFLGTSSSTVDSVADWWGGLQEIAKKANDSTPTDANTQI